MCSILTQVGIQNKLIIKKYGTLKKYFGIWTDRIGNLVWPEIWNREGESARKV